MTHKAKFTCRNKNTIHVDEKLFKYMYLEGGKFFKKLSHCVFFPKD